VAGTESCSWLSNVAELIIAAERGPVTFVPSATGLRAELRSSSVLHLLDCVARGLAQPVRWVAATTTPQDRAAGSAGLFESFCADRGYTLDLLQLDASRYQAFYDDVACRMLWYANHALWDELPAIRFGPGDLDAFDRAYQAVNQRFAERIAAAAGQEAPVFVHDYQLATVPGFLRRHRADLPIAHFIYTSFADPASLSRLPRRVAEAVVDGMLGADLLGFAGQHWAERFLACCAWLGLDTDPEVGTVEHHGRRVWLRCYPLPLAVDDVRERSHGPSARRWAEHTTAADAGRRRIVRVDRLDPAKNALRGFQAYELLLDRRPELRDKVRFVACLVPSRQGVAEYRWYAEQVWAQIERLRRRFPGSVEVHYGDDRERALGILRGYDVLLVNPLLDGMNLVAEEGVLVNEVAGALVLSAGTGVADMLGDHPVRIPDATDLPATAAALAAALDLPQSDRSRRAARMRAIAATGDRSHWFDRQLADLDAIHAGDKPLTSWSPLPARH
jgi:trehalose 6-phosphate synthase